MKKAIYLFTTILLLSFCSFGQKEQINNPDGKYIQVEDILPVIVSQPDSPLKIENVAAVKFSNDQVSILYQVRNIGKKSIANYTIAKWFSHNTGTNDIGVLPDNQNVLKPNGTSGNLKKKIIIPNSSQFEEGVNIKSSASKPGLSRIVFVLVTEIRFTDGSKYEDNETFLSLKTHLKLFELTYEKFDEVASLKF